MKGEWTSTKICNKNSFE